MLRAGSLFDMIHQHLSSGFAASSFSCCTLGAILLMYAGTWRLRVRPYKLRWHGELTVALSLSLGSLQLQRDGWYLQNPTNERRVDQATVVLGVFPASCLRALCACVVSALVSTHVPERQVRSQVAKSGARGWNGPIVCQEQPEGKAEKQTDVQSGMRNPAETPIFVSRDSTCALLNFTTGWSCGRALTRLVKDGHHLRPRRIR